MHRMLAAATMACALFVTLAATASAQSTGVDLVTGMSDSPDPVAPGSNLTYTITVANAGASSATNATLTDTLPGTATFASVTSPAGWSCTTPAVGAGGTVTCSTAAVAPGAVATFTLVMAIPGSTPEGSVFSNTAAASSTEADDTPSDSEATASTTVAHTADLALTMSDAPDPVAPGASITSTLTLTQGGPSTAQNVTLSTPLAPQVRFTSLTVPAGWTCTVPAVGASGTVSCSRASLAPGTSVFTLVTQVEPSVAGGSTITSNASVTSTTPDPDPGDNGATAVTTVAGGSATPDPDQSDDRGSTTTVVLQPATPAPPAATPAAPARRLICRRVPTLMRHSVSGARYILARDGCQVRLRWVGTYRRGGRRRNRITSQSVRPGTPLYEGDTLTVRINGRPRR